MGHTKMLKCCIATLSFLVVIFLIISQSEMDLDEKIKVPVSLDSEVWEETETDEEEIAGDIDPSDIEVWEPGVVVAGNRGSSEPEEKRTLGTMTDLYVGNTIVDVQWPKASGSFNRYDVFRDSVRIAQYMDKNITKHRDENRTEGTTHTYRYETYNETNALVDSGEVNATLGKVHGTITMPTTWKAGLSPFDLSDDVIVEEDGSLEIEGNVVVNSSDYEIEIFGNVAPLKNVTVTGGGFYFWTASGVIIDNCSFNGSTASPLSYGLYLSRTNNSRISNSTFESYKDWSIELYLSNDNHLEYLEFEENTVGISLDTSHNNTFQTCFFEGNSKGFDMTGSSNNTLNKTIAFNCDSAIYLSSNSKDNTIENSEIGTGNYGVYATIGCARSSILNNTINEMDYTGITTGRDCDDSKVQGNWINNASVGIYVYRCKANRVENNTILESKSNGMSISYGGDHRIERNNVTNSSRTGILVGTSYDNIIAFNNVSDNDNGIHLGYRAHRTILRNNQVYNNYEEGVLIESSIDVKMRNNTMSENSYNFGVKGNSLVDHFHDIDTSNLVEGKPIQYLVNVTGITVPMNAGYVGVINSNDVIVRDQNISWNYNGILFSGTTHSTIENVTIKGAYTGIYFRDASHNNSIFNSTISQCWNPGIWLFRSGGAIIGHTTVFQCESDGVLLRESDDNLVYNITAEYCYYGVRVYKSTNNTVWNSTAMRNEQFGFSIMNANGNRLHNNTAYSTSGSYESDPAGFGVGGENNILDNNTAYWNDDGIHLSNKNNRVICNNVTLNKKTGIFITQTTDNVILLNNVSKNNETGIYVKNTGSVTNPPMDNMIYNNTVRGNLNYGIRLLGAHQNTIVFNNITGNNWTGIFLNESMDNLIDNNTIHNHPVSGIHLIESYYNNITWNNASITVNHSASGNSSRGDNGVDYTNATGMFLERSGSNYLLNNSIYHHYKGVYIKDNSTANILRGNNATFNWDAYLLDQDCVANELHYNTAWNNAFGFILLPGCNRTLLENNTAEEISVHAFQFNEADHTNATNNSATRSFSGISVDRSDHSWILNNIINDNSWGLSLSDAWNNTISGNEITNNSYAGISLESSENNLIYNNYFENLNNSFDDGNNTWNISKTAGISIIWGPYLGGNFWSNYQGMDNDNDTLGDTQIPYNNTGNITNGGDYLPLIPYPVVNIDTGTLYETIQEAIDAAATLDGHTLLVSPDTYNENAHVHKSLTIRADADRSDTRVTPTDTNSPVFKISATGVTISGFTISGATKSAGILVEKEGAVIRNCVLSANDDGIKIKEGVTGAIVIRDCVMKENTNNGISSEARWKEDDSNISVTASTITDNDHSGINARGNVNLTECEVDLNRGHGIYAFGTIRLVSVEVGNNTMTGVWSTERNIFISGESSVSYNGLFGIRAQDTLEVMEGKFLVTENDKVGLYADTIFFNGHTIQADITYNGIEDEIVSAGIQGRIITIEGSRVSVNFNNGPGIRGMSGDIEMVNTEIMYNKGHGIHQVGVFAVDVMNVLIIANDRSGIYNPDGTTTINGNTNTVRDNKNGPGIDSKVVIIDGSIIIEHNNGPGIQADEIRYLTGNSRSGRNGINKIEDNLQSGINCNKTLVLNDVIIEDNVGAGIFFTDGQILDVTLTDCTIRNNGGEGILSWNSELELKGADTTIDGNGKYGLRAEFGKIIIQDGAVSGITNNKEGGIWAYNGLTLPSGFTVEDNEGPGIVVAGNDPVILENIKVLNNGGDGIGIVDGDLTLRGNQNEIMYNTGHGVFSALGNIRIEGTDTTIEDNGGYGIKAESGKVEIVSGAMTEVRGNGEGGIFGNDGVTLPPGFIVEDNTGPGLVIGGLATTYLENVKIRGNGGDGIGVIDDDLVLKGSSNEITSNDGHGIMVHGGKLRIEGTGTVVDGNGGVGIRNDGGDVEIVQGAMTSVKNNGGGGIWATEGLDLPSGFTVEDNGGTGIVVGGVDATILDSVKVNNNGGSGIAIIDQGLVIQGTGNEIKGNTENGIRMYSGDVLINGQTTIDNNGAVGIRSDGKVEIIQGAMTKVNDNGGGGIWALGGVTLPSGFIIENNGGTGLAVGGPYATNLENIVVRNNIGIGIDMIDEVLVLSGSGTEIHNNKGDGIHSYTDNIIIEGAGTVIHHNTGWGIKAGQGKVGVTNGARIHNNTLGGIYSAGGLTNVNQLIVEENAGWGIIIEAGDGHIAGSGINGNGQGGIMIKTPGLFNAYDLAVNENKGTGVRIEDIGEGYMVNTQINGNEGNGLWVSGLGRLNAERMTIEQNDQSGFVIETANGYIVGSRIANNGENGITMNGNGSGGRGTRAGNPQQGLIQDCEITSNGGWGIICNNSSPDIIGNTITGNNGGIWCANGSIPKVRFNTIQDNVDLISGEYNLKNSYGGFTIDANYNRWESAPSLEHQILGDVETLYEIHTDGSRQEIITIKGTNTSFFFNDSIIIEYSVTSPVTLFILEVKVPIFPTRERNIATVYAILMNDTKPIGKLIIGYHNPPPQPDVLRTNTTVPVWWNGTDWMDLVVDENGTIGLPGSYIQTSLTADTSPSLSDLTELFLAVDVQNFETDVGQDKDDDDDDEIGAGVIAVIVVLLLVIVVVALMKMGILTMGNDDNSSKEIEDVDNKNKDPGVKKPEANQNVENAEKTGEKVPEETQGTVAKEGIEKQSNETKKEDT